MRTYERFINYAKIHTASDETTNTHPSTERQFDLGRLLVQELEELGLREVHLNQYGIVTAVLPATPGCEASPALGLLAHMDTIPEFSGENVKPMLWPNYDGGDIVLPREGRVIRPTEFPILNTLLGKTIITADGSTVLGADDKAGIAEIVTLCEQLIAEKVPHGKLCIAFTPDEEIGCGTDKFDVAAFGAQYAYTVDGSDPGAIEYENFNAASVKLDITGVSVHPGSAKDVMENALLIAFEINSGLPAEAIPAKTEGYEGFFHLTGLNGGADHAKMTYIIRDHDETKFAAKKEFLEQVVEQVRKAHPTATIDLEIRDSYYNMAAKLTDCMHLVEHAKKAAQMAGVTPMVQPIRGGTDGAVLSYKGLPCPNLGTGGHNFHGPYELVAAEDMDKVVEILKNIVSLYADFTVE